MTHDGVHRAAELIEFSAGPAQQIVEVMVCLHDQGFVVQKRMKPETIGSPHALQFFAVRFREAKDKHIAGLSS
ncbi:hypothetical protein GCM10011359_12680 [Nesterenkonia alkaliphila]|nr:hypothetical protein GCM10011359_12680 [Nesterenkonia alkaliphila]